MEDETINNRSSTHNERSSFMHKYTISGKKPSAMHGEIDYIEQFFKTEQEAIDRATDFLARHPSAKEVILLGPVKKIALKNAPVVIDIIKQ